MKVKRAIGFVMAFIMAVNCAACSVQDNTKISEAAHEPNEVVSQSEVATISNEVETVSLDDIVKEIDSFWSTSKMGLSYPYSIEVNEDNEISIVVLCGEDEFAMAWLLDLELNNREEWDKVLEATTMLCSIVKTNYIESNNFENTVSIALGCSYENEAIVMCVIKDGEIIYDAAEALGY